MQIRVIAVAIRLGSLYYLDCNAPTVKQEVNITERQENKECLWHRLFGHLGIKNLQKMSKGNLVSSFSFDIKGELIFVRHVSVENITEVIFQQVEALVQKSSLV